MSYYGKAKHQGVKVGLDPNAKYYGDELMYKKHLLRPHGLLSRGVIEDFDDYEEFLRFCIADGLRLDASDAQLFLSCNYITARAHRAKLCQAAFEKFNVKGFFL